MIEIDRRDFIAGLGGAAAVGLMSHEARADALEDELNTGVEEEVQALLDDLADDQLAEVLALAWVGRGTFDASEWDDAFAEANDLDNDERMDELLDMPLLAGHLEAIGVAIAGLLDVAVDAVAVKASTGNLEGAEGGGRALSALALATIEAMR